MTEIGKTQTLMLSRTELASSVEDERTARYLEGVRRRIGLLEIVRSASAFVAGEFLDPERVREDDREFEEDMDLGFLQLRAKLYSYAEDGGRRYVAELVQRMADDDVISHVFARRPSAEDVLTALALNVARLRFMPIPQYHGLPKPGGYFFRCWECGRERHWLDIPDEGGGLVDRLMALDVGYCGC